MEMEKEKPRTDIQDALETVQILVGKEPNHTTTAEMLSHIQRRLLRALDELNEKPIEQEDWMDKTDALKCDENEMSGIRADVDLIIDNASDKNEAALALYAVLSWIEQLADDEATVRYMCFIAMLRIAERSPNYTHIIKDVLSNFQWDKGSLVA
jgi:hypothetical protein